jgi:3-isopropylmalate/(R)-2-methylmalate dehydratase small subunit
MERVSIINGIVAPLDRSNVDTDAIIPKQFLKSIHRTGFGPNLFDEWRYLDHGEPGIDCSSRPLNNEFILNQDRYREAKILLTRSNFGCGSSREHAPWAIQDYGFRVILASSFADIFYNNCFKNGLLPIELSEDKIDQLFLRVKDQTDFALTIDLEEQTIIDSLDTKLTFEIDEYKKYCLIHGLDEIGQTLKNKKDIELFEKTHQKSYPWLFTELEV